VEFTGIKKAARCQMNSEPLVKYIKY